MECLRIYSTADGESHFDQLEIPTGSRQVHSQATAFEVSANYATTCHPHSVGRATFSQPCSAAPTRRSSRARFTPVRECESGTKRKCQNARGISGAEGGPAVSSACRPQPPLTPFGHQPPLPIAAWAPETGHAVVEMLNGFLFATQPR
jgi:hypothetical protein